jgi:hypothetical protein
MRRALTVFLLAIVLIGVEAAPVSAASTREEYTQQADPICLASNKAWSRLWKRFLRADKQLKFHAAGNALNAIGTNLAATNDKLRLIAPPPGDEALIGQWIGIWDRIAHFYELAASDYRLGKISSLRQVLKGTVRLSKSAARLVSAFPFQACA